MEQTTSRQVAVDINRTNKYDELLAMNNPIVDKWILTSGLTKEECAMIQPTYGVYTNNYISPAYGISSSVISGLNLSLNAIQMSKRTTNKNIYVVGLISGAGQVALGSVIFPIRTTGYMGRVNESHKALSMVNIGLGTSTMILSAWNLIMNKKSNDKQTTLNVYSFPTQNNNTGVAFSLTHKF